MFSGIKKKPARTQEICTTSGQSREKDHLVVTTFVGSLSMIRWEKYCGTEQQSTRVHTHSVFAFVYVYAVRIGMKTVDEKKPVQIHIYFRFMLLLLQHEAFHHACFFIGSPWCAREFNSKWRACLRVCVYLSVVYSVWQLYDFAVAHTHRSRCALHFK